MDDLLHTTYHQLIQAVQLDTHRFLYADFKINNRLTGMVGPRGVGKTTLLLQYIKEHLYDQNNAFYFTADHLYFSQTTLLEFVTDLHNVHGVQYVFIDEVHRYKNWAQELKNIYDSLPAVYVIFSGSSSLDLVKGSYDLSRRAKLYQLPGLSFREYLYLRAKGQQDYPSISLSTLLTQPSQYNAQLSTIPQILGLFKEYLRQGYYPFVFEDENSYYEKVLRIIDKTIQEDIASYYSLKTDNLYLLKKILSFLAAILPGQISINNIAKNLNIDHKTVFNYLTMLQETGLVRMLYSKTQGGNDFLRKSEKIFLHNTSLLYALNSMRAMTPEIGSVRELFLLSSVHDKQHPIYYSQKGDFLIDEKVLEVGGKNKSLAQLKGVSSGILVKDDVTVATAHVIPLYYFGFLY